MRRKSLGSEKERLAQLRDVLTSKHDSAACQSCQQQLEEYIIAQLEGDNYGENFPQVTSHLDTCLDCAGRYARLYDLLLAEKLNQLPSPENLPAPDLRFLQGHSDAAREAVKTANLRALLRHVWQHTAEKMSLQFSPDLLAALRPLPTTLQTRAPADNERYHELLWQLDAQPELEMPLMVTIYRDGQQPNHCLVEVLVEPPGQSWPDLGGRTVTLRVGSDMHTAVTDAWGMVAFSGIAIADVEKMHLDIES